MTEFTASGNKKRFNEAKQEGNEMRRQQNTMKTLDQLGVDDLLIETSDELYSELRAAMKKVSKRMMRRLYFGDGFSHWSSFVSVRSEWIRHHAMRHHSA